MFLFYVLTFFKKEDTIQGGTLFKEIRYVSQSAKFGINQRLFRNGWSTYFFHNLMGWTEKYSHLKDQVWSGKFIWNCLNISMSKLSTWPNLVLKRSLTKYENYTTSSKSLSIACTLGISTSFSRAYYVNGRCTSRSVQ